jgi:hypothetical protein
MPFCKMILIFICDLIVSRAKLSLELLALRYQLAVLRRTVRRPQIQNRDRWFWKKFADASSSRTSLKRNRPCHPADWRTSPTDISVAHNSEGDH